MQVVQSLVALAGVPRMERFVAPVGVGGAPRRAAVELQNRTLQGHAQG